MPTIYLSGHAKTSCIIRDRSRILLLMMTTREQRAFDIANRFPITAKNGTWTVPSQTGAGKYAVMLKGTPHCTCPDHELHGNECKHILAVRYVIQGEVHADGTTTVTETFEVTKQTTYPQEWPAYNLAQTTEKDRFQILLADLCSGIITPPRIGRGRPTLPLSDAIFSAVFKVYSTFSGRRFMSDLREAQERGYIAAVPHFNSIFNYLENPTVRPILANMIETSALPLKAVEHDFAVDSSGFGVSRFFRWYDHKYGQEKEKRDWVKVHVMCGVKTNVVTAVEIKGRDANDASLLPPLLNTTINRFNVREVSADKGYLSYKNARLVSEAGAVPFIAFKNNSGPGDNRKGSDAWRDMWHYFSLNRSEFAAHYHKRSNIESTFSMMKRKFGDSLRSRTDVAMVNEALCKILCHNLVVLIHEMFELGIDPVFLPNGMKPAQQEVVN